MNKAIILLELRTKFSKKLGLSEKTLSDLADMIFSEHGADATLEQIQTAVTGMEPVAKIIQSAADSARNAAKKEAKEGKGKDNDDAEGGDSEPGKPTQDNETPAWAKAFIEENKALRSEINEMKQGKAKETRRDLYVRELEGLPEAIKTQSLNDFDRLSFKDDEDFTGWIEGKKTGFAELKEANDLNAANSFGRTPKPNGNSAGADKPSTAFKAFQEGRETKAKEVNAKDPFS